MKQAVGVRCPNCTEVVPVAGDWTQKLHNALFRRCENDKCGLLFEITSPLRRYCEPRCRKSQSNRRQRAA